MENKSLEFFQFQHGDRVVKKSGDYTFEGIVVGRLRKLSGVARYVVENKDGILHIFSQTNLELCPPQS